MGFPLHARQVQEGGRNASGAYGHTATRRLEHRQGRGEGLMGLAKTSVTIHASKEGAAELGYTPAISRLLSPLTVPTIASRRSATNGDYRRLTRKRLRSPILATRRRVRGTKRGLALPIAV